MGNVMTMVMKIISQRQPLRKKESEHEQSLASKRQTPANSRQQADKHSPLPLFSETEKRGPAPYAPLNESLKGNGMCQGCHLWRMQLWPGREAAVAAAQQQSERSRERGGGGAAEGRRAASARGAAAPQVWGLQ